MSAVEALLAALRIEHQVGYGYGVVGAHLPGRLREQCRHRLDEHARLRDAVTALVRTAGATPAAPEPAYVLPAPIAGRDDALALAIRLEEAVTGAQWDLVAAAAAGSPARRLGVDALAAAATWAARWRVAAGTGASPALPGRP